MLWNAGGADRGPQLGEPVDPFQPALTFADERTQLRENLIVRAGELHHLDDSPGLFGRRAGRLAHFLGHALGADLGQLIERAQNVGRHAFQTERFQQAGEHHAVVDVDREPLEADGPQQVVDDEDRFGVGGDRAGADRIEIALHEFAVAAALRVLAAPHGGDVVALERRAQLADVLGGEAGQRHGEVEPQADIAAAVVLEPIELLIGFRAPLAEQHVEVLECRRIDRAEPVRAEHAPRDIDNLLARQHGLRQIVAEALQGAGLDGGRHGEGCRMQDAGCREESGWVINRPRILYPASRIL